MNDKTASQNASPVAQPGQTDSAKPQSLSQKVQSAQPVGSINKEAERGSVSEFLKPTDAELPISQELKDIGVEEKKDEPNIADEHRNFIDHAKQFTSVPTTPSDKISLPMSEDKITEELKTAQDDDSSKWFAKLIEKVMKVLGL